MRFAITFELTRETRTEVEELVSTLVPEATEVDIRSLGPNDLENAYSPEVDITESAHGWCLVLDGETIVLGIPPMDSAKEFDMRNKLLDECTNAETEEDHLKQLKHIFLTLLQLILGDHCYFKSQRDVSRVMMMVKWTFMHPQHVLPPQAREKFIVHGGIPGLADLEEGLEDLDESFIPKKKEDLT